MTEHEQTIFLVDDDPAVRRSLSSALGKRGYSVTTFESAGQFLEAYDIERPGCLLLDLSMPGMTGLELQQALGEAGIEIPIIFITGQGDIPQSVQAIKAGAVDFLEKPFKLEILLERVREAFAIDSQVRDERGRQEAVRLRFERLTGRELEVMRLVISGAGAMSSKEIARELGISHRTVDHHRARIMEKTAARSVADLARLARSIGLGS